MSTENYTGQTPIPENNTQFENQFEKREYFDVAGGRAEVVDIIPEKPKDEVPVFIAPGWGCDVNVYKQALEIMSDHQRRAISISHPRRGGNLEEQATREQLDMYPSEKLRKSYNILGVIEQKDIKRVDVLAHSEGAINIVLAAVIHPEKFRNIILFAPAGLIGKDSFLGLAKRFLSQDGRGDSLADMPISEEEKYTGQAAMRSVKEYLLANPLRALREVFETSQIQIDEMVRYLHDKGIGIVVMSGIDDPVFPTADLQKMLSMDMIDGFMTLRGAHGSIAEQKDHLIWAEKMLAALEEQSKKSHDGHKPDLSEEFV